MALSIVATLGSVTFHGWSGWAPKIKDNGESYSRLGQVGTGSQIINSTGPEFTATAWKAFTTKSDALSFADSITDLQWEVVKLSDAYGRSFPRVRVSSAEAMPKASKGPAVTGTTPAIYRVDCSFKLEVLP